MKTSAASTLFAAVLAACAGAGGGISGDASIDGQPDGVADAEAGPEVVADADADADTDTAPDTDPTWQDRFAHVFPTDHVVDLRLDFAAGDWEKLLMAWQTTQQKKVYPAAFTFDTESLAAVGVRLKGLNSLNVPPSGPINLAGKYPLKIDFNKVGGPRFHEVDEVALNTSGNDASRMRDRLTASMYGAMGVEASRTSWADVRIGGVHVGLYVTAQVIDKRFLKERFGEADHADDGNLYKCVYNSFGACSLAWQGDDPASYVSEEGCAEGYDRCGLVLQTNEDDPTQNTYADLIHLLDVLNNTPAEQFEAELAKVFDVPHFLRLAAVAYATSNFDSYFGKGHNYYLYHRSDGLFQMIPWDFDLAFGNTECPTDPSDPTCGGAESHPLTRKIMAVAAWREAYLGELKTLLDTAFTEAQVSAWVSEADALIAPFVAGDPNLPGEGSYAEQIDPKAAGVGNLFRFLEARRAFILQGLGE